MAMLGDIVELSVVVRDLDEAAARFMKLFGLRVHRRDTSDRFGFKNAILPTGIGHIELMQPTDPGKAVGKFLAKRGEGVYLVGFECGDVAGAGGAVRGGGGGGGSPPPRTAAGGPPPPPRALAWTPPPPPGGGAAGEEEGGQRRAGAGGDRPRVARSRRPPPRATRRPRRASGRRSAAPRAGPTS